MESSDVVIVCEDAGAAAALCVVGEQLARDGRLCAVVAGVRAEPAFTAKGLRSVSDLRAEVPDGDWVLLTGSTMWGDRIEARAVAEARKLGRWSVTFLDFWSNYVARLSYPSAVGLEVLPSRLAVIDERMRDDLLALGIDRESMAVTGSPAFDQVLERPQIIPDPTGPVVFLSQPIEALYGQSLGYTEATILLALAHRVLGLGRRLVVRPHPRENVDHLREIVAGLPGSCSVEQDDFERLLRSASIVVGMTTMALVEAALRGLPTLSLQLGTSKKQELPTTCAGFTALLVEEADIASALASIQAPCIPRTDFWSPGSARRVITLLDAE